jgi:hypothetical protein
MCATAPWSGEPGLYGEKRLSGRPQTEAVVQPSLPGMRGPDVNLGDHEDWAQEHPANGTSYGGCVRSVQRFLAGIMGQHCAR